jgi:hypothetical protein
MSYGWVRVIRDASMGWLHSWKIFEETEAPGISWAAVSTGEALCFNIGKGTADDRYLRRYAFDRPTSELLYEAWRHQAETGNIA